MTLDRHQHRLAVARCARLVLADVCAANGVPHVRALFQKLVAANPGRDDADVLPVMPDWWPDTDPETFKTLLDMCIKGGWVDVKSSAKDTI